LDRLPPTKKIIIGCAFSPDFLAFISQAVAFLDKEHPKAGMVIPEGGAGFYDGDFPEGCAYMVYHEPLKEGFSLPDEDIKLTLYVCWGFFQITVCVEGDGGLFNRMDETDFIPLAVLGILPASEPRAILPVKLKDLDRIQKESGASLMVCKRALEVSQNDCDIALHLLTKNEVF
jgi:hypothetical protein